MKRALAMGRAKLQEQPSKRPTGTPPSLRASLAGVCCIFAWRQMRFFSCYINAAFQDHFVSALPGEAMAFVPENAEGVAWLSCRV